MESDIEKCTMLIMKSGKQLMTAGIELPNKENVRRKGKLQIFGNIGSEHHQTCGDKRKNLKEYLRRTKKLLQTKLHGRNLIKVINTWTVPLVRCSGPFLKWIREELQQMDQRTGKLMTMRKALDPRDDINRLYESRKEGGRGVASIQDSVDASRQRLEDYIKKHRERSL